MNEGLRSSPWSGSGEVSEGREEFTSRFMDLKSFHGLAQTEPAASMGTPHFEGAHIEWGGERVPICAGEVSIVASRSWLS